MIIFDFVTDIRNTNSSEATLAHHFPGSELTLLNSVASTESSIRFLTYPGSDESRPASVHAPGRESAAAIGSGTSQPSHALAVSSRPAPVASGHAPVPSTSGVPAPRGRGRFQVRRRGSTGCCVQ